MGLELFNTKTNHICTIQKKTSMSMLPILKSDTNFLKRITRTFKKLILISERNPRTTEFYRSYSEILYTRRKQIKSNSLIIHPFSFLRAFYEIWLVVLFLICLIYMPFRAAFVSFTKIPVELSLFVLCVIDMIMTFFTGYIDTYRKRIVMEPKRIAKHYLFSVYFITDVLSSFPNIFSTSGKLARIIYFLSFLKITRLPTLYYYLSNTSDFLGNKSLSVRIFKFIVLVFLVVHWFACIQYALPGVRELFMGSYHPESWIITKDLLRSSLKVQYLKSFYKASSNLLCIVSNYESFVWEETVVRLSAYIFGKIFFLILSVNLLNMIMQMRILETKYFETITELKSYMKNKKLPIETQKKLLQYYKYKYRNKFFKENVITGLLSDKLKREINMDTCRRLVETVSIFQDLPPKSLEDVLSQLRAEIYLPNDIIIRSGAIGDCMYFLASGTVCVSTPLGKEVCHLQDGAYFGEVALLVKGKKRTANIVAIEICEVYKLETKGFRHCFLKNPIISKKMDALVRQRLKTTEEIDRLQQLILKSGEVTIPENTVKLSTKKSSQTNQ